MFVVAKRKNIIIFIKLSLAVLLFIASLYFQNTTKLGISNGIELVLNSVVPSLFPSIILADYISKLICEKYTKPNILTVFLLSLIGGFPSGAIMLKNLVSSNTITENYASKSLSGFVNAGPGFLIGVIGYGLFKSTALGVVFFASSSLASLFCFLVFKGHLKQNLRQTVIPQKNNAVSIIGSIKTAITSMALISGYVVIFSCVVAFLDLFLSKFFGETFKAFAFSIVEVTNAVEYIAVNVTAFPLYFVVFAISMCGISVAMQIKAIVFGYNITLKYFFLSRIIHFFVSAVFVKLLTTLFPIVLNTSAISSEAVNLPFEYSPISSFLLFIIAFVLLFGKKGFSFN